MNRLKIRIHQSVDEAPNYEKPEFIGAELKSAEILQRGTIRGLPTVDLIFEDNNGQKYVAIVTARMLEMVVKASGVKIKKDSNE